MIEVAIFFSKDGSRNTQKVFIRRALVLSTGDVVKFSLRTWFLRDGVAIS